jgi:hypothetical protein
MADEHLAYEGLGMDYTHNIINHAESYAEGNVHTNRAENFWSLLKRAIKGSYVSKVIGAISGKRLTCARVKG